ncbi:MAG: serine hydrolase, partial [Spartobacteria bacterium]
MRLTFCFLFLAAANLHASNLDPAAVRKAAKYSAEHRGSSLLVIEKGETLLEDYPGKANKDDPQRIYSGTKAFWNLAALAAAEDGILDLDQPVADT